jgi:hypothetical protein
MSQAAEKKNVAARAGVIALAILAVNVSALLAETSSKAGLPERTRQAARPAYGPTLRQADVLICLDIDAWAGFADLTPTYSAAFTQAGATSISTCAVEVRGGTVNFPSGLTPWNYPVVVVLTSENWFDSSGGSGYNIDPTDEAMLGGYLDLGGRLLFVGQDYMWGSHPEMDGPGAPCSGFPREYLGLDICHQDATESAGGDPLATITGSSGWLFDGESFSLDATTVFLANDFFGDCADPTATAGYAFSYDEAAQDGVVIWNATRGFKTVWAGIELAAASQTDFHHMIDVIYDWLLADSPVEDRTWGRIKAIYR